jgi:pimeloyl-ACP methyl ester carboxylesterase
MYRYSYFFLSGIAVLAMLLLASFYFYKDAAATETRSAAQGYQFFKMPCWFDADWTAEIVCGELHAPVAAGFFRLPVVILKEESAERRADPVVYLQGGPGASARLHTEGVKSWLSWQRYAGIKRDIILIDTRGTGHSKPALVCAEYNRTNQSLLTKHTSLTEELTLGQQLAYECFDGAVKANPALDYRHFSSIESARDVRALINLLGYEKWNILGVSYGTRLALEIARQEALEPQQAKLQSMVLDSVYPAGFGGVQTWPQVLDDALQKFFTGCAATPECSAVLGSAEAQVQQVFMQTLNSLRATPIAITIKHWDGEAPINFLLNDHRFLSAAFASTYTPQDWLKIAEAITGVAKRNREAIKPLVEPFVNQSMSADFNSLTFTAVDCADNPVMSEQDFLASVNQYPLLQEYTRDQWRYQLCHRLSAASPLQLSEPLVPSLLLAGSLDPITPVDWARRVHAQWPASQLHISENVAHSVLGSEACLLQSLINFYDHPTEIFQGCQN